jgi:hypothetical protein
MKRWFAGLATALTVLLLGAPTADAARLRGYISKIHVGNLTGGGTARVFIHTETGTFCGVAEISGISAGTAQVSFESARASVLSQGPGSLQHFTIWWTNSPAGFCTADVGEATAYFFYHQ